jgi:DNA-binding NtrC family response regulator
MARIRPRVLIVDEDSASRTSLGEFLEGKRYEVLSADSASGVLDTVRRRRPHVVLLDVNLARAAGGTAIMTAISATAPVIVITAEADVEIARKTVQDGAFDFVMKPFDLRRVRQLIDEALEHSPDLL